MAIGGSITSATAGSVLFAGASGVLQQNNANFFWDITNNRLGLGTTSPTFTLDVNGTARVTSLNIVSPNTYSIINGTGPDSVGNTLLFKSGANTVFTVNSTGESSFSGSGAFLAVSDRSGGYANRMGFYANANTANLFSVTLSQNIFSVGTTNGRITLGRTGYAYDGNATTSKVTILSEGNTSGGALNILNSSSSSLFYVRDNGNIGIATTTDAGFKLDVNGTARVQGNTQFGTGFYWDNTNARLGIGIASPSYLLDIRSNVNSGTEAIRVTNTNTGNAAVAGIAIQASTAYGSLFATSSGYTTIGVLQANRIGFYTTSSFAVAVAVGDFIVGTGSSLIERMRVTEAGRLLLGTSTESTFLLDVNGTARIQNKLSVGTPTQATAVLEVTSTTQGFLPPRMTTSEKNAISSPATGLVVFDTTLGKLCVFATTWQTITSI